MKKLCLLMVLLLSGCGTMFTRLPEDTANYTYHKSDKGIQQVYKPSGRSIQITKSENKLARKLPSDVREAYAKTLEQKRVKE